MAPCECVVEQLADCANKKSYSALLNSLDRLALALRAVFLGFWARFPRVNNNSIDINFVTAKLLGGYSPPSPPASAAYGFNYRVASHSMVSVNSPAGNPGSNFRKCMTKP